MLTLPKTKTRNCTVVKIPQLIRDLFGFCRGKLMEFVFHRLILGLFHYTASTADVTGHTVSRKDKLE